MNDNYCKNCKTLLYPIYNFCPTCGLKIKDPVITVSVAKQIGVYLLSFFLPPLGLWPGIKYLRQGSEKVKMVGIIAVVLTVLSVIISLWAFFGFFKTVTTTLTPSSDQTQIQELGL